MKLKRTLAVFGFYIAAMLFSYAPLYAAAPSRTLGFQGQLFNGSTPLTGSVNATFTLYDALSGGSTTGSPVSKTVTVNSGYFAAQFTEADLSGVNFDQQLYLEVSINGTTLSPRTTLNAAALSLKTFGAFSYSAAPSVGPAGSLYFNSFDNTLYVSTGSAWIASAASQWANGSSSISYTSGNVGIRTTTPQAGLDIASGDPAGSLRIGADLGSSTMTAYTRKIGRIVAPTYEGNGTGSNVFLIGMDANSTGNTVNIGGGPGFGVNGATALSFNTVTATGTNGGVTAMYINGTQNIGIGLTPGTTNKVHIRNASNQLRLDVDASNGLSVNATSTGFSTFTVNGTSPGFGFMGGNIGVGTTSPEYLVDIAGTGSTFAIRDFITSSFAGSFMRLMHARGTQGAPTAVGTGDRLGAILFQGYDGTSFGSAAAGIDAFVDGAVATNSIPTSLRFFTTTVGSTTRMERFRVDSNGAFGIGTSTPTVQLHVQGTTTSVIRISNGSSPEADTLLGATGDSSFSSLRLQPSFGNKQIALALVPAGTGTSSVIQMSNGSSSWYIRSVANSGFSIDAGNANTAAMFITNTKNIGIGTTAPTSTLQVVNTTANGQLRLGYDESNYVPFSVNSSGNLTVFPTGSGVTFGNATNTTSALYIARNSTALGGMSTINAIFSLFGGSIPASHMVISSGGNVGIGTTTTSAQLTTSGTVRFAALTGSGANLIVDTLGNVTVSSDERLKDIQGAFSSGLDKVKALNPILFRWKPETGYDATSTYAGFSAQNVQSAIPEAVSTDARGFLTLADRPILAALVNAVKELASKVDGFATHFFSKEIETERICVKKSNGTSVCLTGDELEAVMANRYVNVVPENIPVTMPVATDTASTTLETLSDTSISSSTPATVEAPAETQAPEPETVPTQVEEPAPASAEPVL